MGSATFDFSPLSAALRGLAEAPKDLTPTMQMLADQLVVEVHDHWDSAGEGSWAPYAASTIAKKGAGGSAVAKPSRIPRNAKGQFAARGSADMLRMLFETGDAYGSVKPDFGADFAQAGSDVPYLVYHLGDGPHEKIPKRDPFEISEQMLDKAADDVLRALVTKAKG